jgi:hypothetical protein
MNTFCWVWYSISGWAGRVEPKGRRRNWGSTKHYSGSWTVLSNNWSLVLEAFIKVTINGGVLSLFVPLMAVWHGGSAFWWVLEPCFSGKPCCLLSCVGVSQKLKSYCTYRIFACQLLYLILFLAYCESQVFPFVPPLWMGAWVTDKKTAGGNKRQTGEQRQKAQIIAILILTSICCVVSRGY